MLKKKKWGSRGFRKVTLVATLLFLPLLAQGEMSRRSLSLELDDVPGSTGYEIRVTKILADNSKKPPVMFSIKKPEWSAKLVPGKYTMEVRSFDSRHVPGNWSDPQEFVVKLPAVEQVKPEDAFVIKSAEAKTDKVDLEWKSVEGAEKYKVKVLDGEGTLVQDSVEKENTIKISLPVGHDYSWSVTPVMEGEIEGEAAAAPRKFELFGGKLDDPKIKSIDDVNTTEFNWAQPDFATNYKFTLETLSETGEWKSFDLKETKINHRLYKNPIPSGKYRATVIAKADHRADSEAVQVEFKTTYLNTRSPAAVEQVKSESSYETKSIYFGLASYYVTSVNPSASTYDNGQTQPVPVSNAVGGTGRLGFGTWFKEDNKIGVMAVADVSGYSYSNPQAGQSGTAIYYSGTLEGIYRERLGALGQLRLTLGGQYRLLPVTVSDNLSLPYTRQSMIINIGPVAGVSLLHAFTHRIGAQLNFQVMDSLLGVTTPNGFSNIPTPSYQLGVMGSLNITPSLVGFVGYAFRDEVAKYAILNSAVGNGANRVEISGNYINLLLEYGF